MQEPPRVKVARRHLVEIGGESLAGEVFPHASVALGVSTTTTGYCLAVRIFDRNPATRRMALWAMNRARGEVDARFVGRVRATVQVPRGLYQNRARPLLPGFSIAHHRSTAGTLGAFVTRPDGYVYMLSNNHVFANTNTARAGDAVVQPGPADGGTHRDSVGWFARAARIQRTDNEMDAAIAAMSATMDYEATYDGAELLGIRDTVDMDDVVWKVGRTTGLTFGRITGFNMDNVEVDYATPGGTVTCSFNDQIEIKGPKGQFFSRPGDSGSLIIGDDYYAVGLLFAGSDAGVTFANPIGKVLRAFDAELLT